MPRSARRVPDPPGAAVDAPTWSAATATPTTAATSTPTTAPATCSSSPGSASTRTSASSTPTPRSAPATARSSVRVSDALGDDRLQPVGRAVPHRGDRAAADGSGSSATPTTTGSASTSRGTARSPRSRSRRHVCARAAGRSSTPGASPRSARGRACSRVEGDEIAVDRTPGSAPATARGASGRSASPSRRAAAPTRPTRGLLVAATCRCASTTSRSSLIVQEDARRPPHAERGRAGLAGRGGTAHRAARVARDRHPLPVRHPSPRGRHDPRSPSRDGKPLVLEVETLGFVALNSGPATAATRPGTTARGRAATGSRAWSPTSPTRPWPAWCRSASSTTLAEPPVDGAEGWGLSSSAPSAATPQRRSPVVVARLTPARRSTPGGPSPAVDAAKPSPSARRTPTAHREPAPEGTGQGVAGPSHRSTWSGNHFDRRSRGRKGETG